MLKTLTCADCRVAFTYDHQSGATRQRCEQCKAARKKLTDAAKSARWRAADPERQKAYDRRYNDKRKDDPAFRQRKRDNELLRSYGLTRQQVNDMLEQQGHLCAICKGEHVGPGLRLHVDHCHATKKVRALLCARCNTLLGLAGDDPARLEAAATYLKTHTA